MKAIDKLIELRKIDSSIVAIAKDDGGSVFFYLNEIPFRKSSIWDTSSAFSEIIIEEDIEFDSNNWKECIVTINDLENYEVKMMSISVQEYERLLQAEKTLQNIQNIISKC